MTIETMVNIISILAICISLASIALCIYGRVQDRRVAAAIAEARIRPSRTPPLLKNREVVIWRPAEDGQPDHGGFFLITEEISHSVSAVSTRWFDSKEKEWLNIGGRVIAWAELPEPYKRPAEK